MSDDEAQYARWRANLEATAKGERFIVTMDPDPGFYKARLHRGGPFYPVWIYPKPTDGKPWRAQRTLPGGKVEIMDVHDAWAKVLGRAITMEEYEHVAENGGEWFGTDEIVGQQIREDSAAAGSNEPGDEAEILKDQITQALIGSDKYAKLVKWTKRGRTDIPIVESFIKDDATFEKAQTMRSRLLELDREADKKRETEKAPVLKEERRIEDRWRFRKQAEEGALIIREAMAAYQTTKIEAERKAEADRQAALTAAAAEEDISFAAVAQAASAPAPAPAPTVVKGSYGRAATLGEAWDVVAITDQDALYGYLKEHPDLKKCLLDLAQRSLNKHPEREVPGIEKRLRATIN